MMRVREREGLGWREGPGGFTFFTYLCSCWPAETSCLSTFLLLCSRLSKHAPIERCKEKKGGVSIRPPAVFTACNERHTLVAFMLSSKKCASPKLLDMVLV